MSLNVRRLIPWILILLIKHVFLPVHAASEQVVTKYNLPYEVTQINVTSDAMIINGWAFISYKQHFINGNDHSVELEFVSSTHTFRQSAALTYTTQTSMMEYFGSPNCSASSLFQAPEVCNYSYDQVGFSISIPLSSFNLETVYQTNIIVNAFQADLSYKTPMYYPLAQDLIFSQGGKEFTIISRLDDTELKVNATTVLARKEPSKTGLTWFYGVNCSTTYQNQVYFLKDSIYKNVYEKALVGDTSFYRVSANLYLCSLYRRRIVEGTMLSPVWIASPYVLYSGSPLQIHVKTINQAPYITTQPIEIYEGESINVYNYVHAYDPEEGDISSKLVLMDSNLKNTPGLYTLTFSVSDSFGLTATNTLIVNVLTIPNFIPTIYAEDQIILQYSYFDPIEYATAYDYEDGDLTASIYYTGHVDTYTLGTYKICYYAEDSKFALVELCRNVNVIDYAEFSSRFRFISKNTPFYNEDIPINWLNQINELNNLIHTTDTLFTITLE